VRHKNVEEPRGNEVRQKERKKRRMIDGKKEKQGGKSSHIVTSLGTNKNRIKAWVN